MSAYLLLGRTGDILACLPFLKAEADAGEKPTLIVSNQHSDVLDGCSYVNTVKFDGGIHLLREAFTWAKEKYPDVKSLQLKEFGKNTAVREITYGGAGMEHFGTTCFVKEMWKIAGKLPLWDDALPLVFDKRSPEREAALLKACKVEGTPGRKKPLLLVSVAGHSSPFPYADLLMELLRLRFGKEFRVLELPKAERIYDLLALYERAHCLVCTDSAPLHLAPAVPGLPVMALTNDRPTLWFGSPWLPQHAWYCRYHDFPERAVEMLAAIAGCREVDSLPFIRVWNEYDSKQKLGSFTRNVIPVCIGMCGRDSANTVKDPKRVPYLKDCLRMGLQRAKEDNLVCLIRPDTIFNKDQSGWVRMRKDPSFAYRMTRNGSGDTFSTIADMFCASKTWWKSRLAEIPDLLFGSDYYWSEALRVLFQKHGAVDVTGACYRVEKEKA